MSNLSLIIPAHNEASVIGRLLAALRDGSNVRKRAFLRLVIICNGCSDRTADAARQFPTVEVIETDMASKVHALNLGDRAARGFPRIYVDADVVIDHASVLRLADALGQPGVLAAAPVPKVDLSACSTAVRRFYAVDQFMPSHIGGIGGSGVYALSAEGRARFGEFPSVIADDAFVRRHFALGERVAVPEAVSLVTPPSTMRGLIRIKTRSHLGNLEISHRFPYLTEPSSGGNRRRLLELACWPTWWLAVATYVYVKAVAKWRARRQWERRLKEGQQLVWERDETSRRAATAAGG